MLFTLGLFLTFSERFVFFVGVLVTSAILLKSSFFKLGLSTDIILRSMGLRFSRFEHVSWKSYYKSTATCEFW